jgi:hypothetical protein
MPRNASPASFVWTAVPGFQRQLHMAARPLLALGALAVALGLVLTMASYTVVVSAGPADPDPTTTSFVEARGWPGGYALELVQPRPEPGVRIRFEEQWLPSYLDFGWAFGRWNGLYFTLDWIVFSAICMVAIGGPRFIIRRITAPDLRVDVREGRTKE